MKREDYDEKFICSQCGETIFVFGMPNTSPVCAVCRAMTGWRNKLADRSAWHETFRFSEELQALIAVGSSENNSPTSVQCIYLDANGKSQREP